MLRPYKEEDAGRAGGAFEAQGEQSPAPTTTSREPLRWPDV